MKHGTEIERLTPDLLAGRIGFDEYSRATEEEWRSLARMLLRRWIAPPSVGEDDLVQEMLVRAWDCVSKYDPERGTSLHQFVTWNAVDKAKKWLHKARNATREGDRGRARYPLSMSTLGNGDKDVGELIEGMKWRPEDVPGHELEREQERTEHLVEILEGLGELDQMLVLAFVDANGDSELAARRLWSNSDSRLLLRVGDRHDVRRRVRRAVKKAVAADRSAASTS